MLNLHQDLLVQYLHFTMIAIITYSRKQWVRLITIPSLIMMYMFITMVMTMIIVMTVIMIKSNSDDDDDIYNIIIIRIHTYAILTALSLSS